MKDNFSHYAAGYARYRPHYPKELFDYLAALTAQHERAWDAGTGNGQVAAELASRYALVLATDISSKQLAEAPPVANITYQVAGEKVPDVPDHSLDLVTVAQAIHWFNREVFYAEVKRVAKPSAILAVWCYSLVRIRPDMDALLDTYYTNIIGPYWDAERRLVDEAYRTITFPFDELQAPPMAIHLNWTVADFEGYLGTWSALQHFIKANGYSPVEGFMEQIRPLWAEGELPVQFPLHIRVGRV